MNVVRVCGLAAAGVNGLFASFVVFYYRDSPLATRPCERADAQSSESGTGLEERPRTTYAMFWMLVIINAAVVALGKHSFA